MNEALVHRAQLEKEVAEVREVVPGRPDPRVELAFVRLAELNVRHPRVITLQSRLAQWGDLNATARSELLDDVDTFVADQEQQGATTQFLRVMGQRFKPEVDAFLGLLTFAVVTTLGIVVACSFLEEGALAFGIIMALVAAIVSAVMVHRRFRRGIHKKFFQATFLPEAHRTGIGMVRVLAMLQQVDPSDENCDAGVRALSKALPVLLEVIDEKNPDGNTDFAEIAASFANESSHSSSSLKWIGRAAMLGFVIMAVAMVFWVASVKNERDQAEAEQRNAYLTPFVARLPEYTADPLGKDIQQPHRVGKVIPINVNAKQIDGIVFDLPQALRADRPEEVGTIVWLEWGNESVGKYPDGKDAIVFKCKVTVIDKSKNVIIAEQEVRGSPPPAQRKNHEPHHGSVPIGEVIGWLASLPVR